LRRNPYPHRYSEPRKEAKLAYRKKTIRRMSPVTRRYAKILNELAGIMRKLKNLTEDIARLETDSKALYKRQKYYEKGGDNESEPKV
jgi:hypothetical protein